MSAHHCIIQLYHTQHHHTASPVPTGTLLEVGVIKHCMQLCEASVHP